MNNRILMYHSLESGSYPSEKTKEGDLVYVIQLDTFMHHLEILKTRGYEVILVDKANRDVLGGDFDNKVMLTFDDGHHTNYTLAYPLLIEHNFKAHFFVTTDWLNSKYYMTDVMLRELVANGMTIGSHGASHSYLTDLDEADAYRELEMSKKYLEDKLGCPVTSFSAPAGRINSKIIRMARSLGYTDIFVSDPNPRWLCDGVNLHGRLAVKRGYSLDQFARMLVSGRQPESTIFTMGVTLAKGLMGTKNYRAIREAALRLVSKDRC